MSVSAMRPCIVIPCYNHGQMLAAVLEKLQTYNLPIFVVDDGSAEPTQQALALLQQQFTAVVFERLPQNLGKGGAVLAGLRLAQQAGFTHAIQVDADGQHSLQDLPKLLAEAQQYPQHLISGCPIYDNSIPAGRRYGRYATHIWVWIETLSFSLKDSMCGFRVYPIASTLDLATKNSLGLRMDFDVEIMVRLYWQGVETRFIPTRVIYPDDGLSNFDVLWDNVRISWLHTRLFFGMLPRIPQLLWRKWKR